MIVDPEKKKSTMQRDHHGICSRSWRLSKLSLYTLPLVVVTVIEGAPPARLPARTASEWSSDDGLQFVVGLHDGHGLVLVQIHNLVVLSVLEFLQKKSLYIL